MSSKQRLSHLQFLEFASACLGETLFEFELSGSEHECRESPTLGCMYNEDDDPCNDFCIFCGQPSERK